MAIHNQYKQPVFPRCRCRKLNSIQATVTPLMPNSLGSGFKIAAIALQFLIHLFEQFPVPRHYAGVVPLFCKTHAVPPAVARAYHANDFARGVRQLGAVATPRIPAKDAKMCMGVRWGGIACEAQR